MERILWDGMKRADRDILRELLRYYGSPEAADEAIREAMKDPETIESWATLVTSSTERERKAKGHPPDFATQKLGLEWKFDQIPAPLRSWALETMAAAMLAWTAQQERGAVA